MNLQRQQPTWAELAAYLNPVGKDLLTGYVWIGDGSNLAVASDLGTILSGYSYATVAMLGSYVTAATLAGYSYAPISTVPTASTTTPLVDGTATYGIGATWARGDHVHPTDTSRAVSNASLVWNGNTYSLGSTYTYTATTAQGGTGVANNTLSSLTLGGATSTYAMTGILTGTTKATFPAGTYKLVGTTQTAATYSPAAVVLDANGQPTFSAGSAGGVQSRLMTYTLVSTASGSVTYTMSGTPFTPKALTITAVAYNTYYFCWGSCDQNLNQACITTGYAAIAGIPHFGNAFWLTSGNASISLQGVVTSFNSGNFVMTITNSGGWTGTYYLIALVTG